MDDSFGLRNRADRIDIVLDSEEGKVNTINRHAHDDLDSSRMRRRPISAIVVFTVLVALLVAGLGSFLAPSAVWSITRSDFPVWFWTISSLVVGGASGAILLPVFEYLRRVRYIDLRIAITGQPEAGKTMFSVGLFNALLSERGSQLRFTAEAQTIISVYQAITKISKNVWPPSTPLDVVNRYEGRLRYGASRNGIDLELGDSAGQYWAAIDDKVDASYLKYVLSADAIAHVIPADHIVEPSASHRHTSLNDERNDLLLASRLARAARKRHHLLVILSKLDLVLDDPARLQDVCLKVWFSKSPALSTVLKEALGAKGAQDVLQFIASVESEFESVAVTFSSVTGETVALNLPEEISHWLLRISRR